MFNNKKDKDKTIQEFIVDELSRKLSGHPRIKLFKNEKFEVIRNAVNYLNGSSEVHNGKAN